MTISNILGVANVALESLYVLLAGVSAYYIWRQLTAVAIGGQAMVSEQFASQSIVILKYIADDPLLYEYFYNNKPLSDDRSERTKVLCRAEMMANFLEHVVLQKPSLPKASQEAWMLYVREHYNKSCVVQQFVTRHSSWYAGIFLGLFAEKGG